MSYIDGTLVPGERIIYRAHVHWITFFWSAVVFLLFTGWAAFVATKDNNPGVAFVIFLIGTLPLVWSYIRYRCSEFAVTDKRVLIKTGLIARHTLETLLNKIENIGIEQTLMGRALNYGTVQVTGTGSTKETFTNIAAPLEFRKQVQGATLNYDAVRGGLAEGQSSTPLSEREERDCPFCAERILVKAKICRFCGRETPALPA